VITQRSRTLRHVVSRAFVVALALAVGACSEAPTVDDADGDGVPTRVAGAVAEPGSEPVAPASEIGSAEWAEERVEAITAGTFGRPPDSGPAAVAGVTIRYVSFGESSESFADVTRAAVEAGAAIGWEVEPVDGRFDPARVGQLISEAVSDGVDGIMFFAIDCGLVQGALTEAQQAEIPVVAFDAYDCDDPNFGGSAPLFTATPNMSDDHPDLVSFYRAWGQDKAAYAIASTTSNARVINVAQGDSLVVAYINEGFEAAVAGCAGCEVVDTIQVTNADLQSGGLNQKLATALAEHPDANVVHLPYDGLTLLGASTAIDDSGRSAELVVVGGEGFASNLELIRGGGAQDASVAFSNAWETWAAFDTMNRVLSGDSTRPGNGLGWQLVDGDTNLPTAGGFVPAVDFRAAYREIWVPE
jgi:ribose transport system substrate-binding protein